MTEMKLKKKETRLYLVI